MLRISNHRADPSDPWRQLLAAIIYQALLDARHDISYSYEALLFLNSPNVGALVAFLGIDGWPRWTKERAQAAKVDKLRRRGGY